eukprot:TRINITY_DN43172_c0_g1_i1.p1 TRINITY_DN43172_c0_g1~~TRINITY_DN43172_c0_g1_i1.p1  ORF type:complete len:325 (-),score=31.46 TRINITY_DN43172_c0_g1_i1:23-976(-)
MGQLSEGVILAVFSLLLLSFSEGFTLSTSKEYIFEKASITTLHTGSIQTTSIESVSGRFSSLEADYLTLPGPNFTCDASQLNVVTFHQVTGLTICTEYGWEASRPYSSCKELPLKMRGATGTTHLLWDSEFNRFFEADCHFNNDTDVWTVLKPENLETVFSGFTSNPSYTAVAKFDTNDATTEGLVTVLAVGDTTVASVSVSGLGIAEIYMPSRTFTSMTVKGKALYNPRSSTPDDTVLPTGLVTEILSHDSVFIVSSNGQVIKTNNWGGPFLHYNGMSDIKEFDYGPTSISNLEYLQVGAQQNDDLIHLLLEIWVQ